MTAQGQATVIEPFHFGAADARLFGVMHRPRATPPGRVVVICPTFGHEYVVTHRALRAVAAGLADAGVAALRFDLWGSGDSAGSGRDATLERWVESASAALAAARERTGAAQVALLGLRLGASAASLAAERDGEIDALALWEPVITGARFLEAAAARHHAWHDDYVERFRRVSDDARESQLLGYPLTTVLEESLAELDLARVERAPAPRMLLVSSREGETEAALEGALRASGASIERWTREDAGVWDQSLDVIVPAAPAGLIRELVAWLTR